MENTHCLPLRIDQDYRQTVGSLNCEQQAWGRGDQAITKELFFRDRFDAVNEIRVNLANTDEWPERIADNFRSSARYGADCLYKGSPILFYGSPRVVFRKPEIQVAFAIGARKSSRATTKRRLKKAS